MVMVYVYVHMYMACNRDNPGDLVYFKRQLGSLEVTR